MKCSSNVCREKGKDDPIGYALDRCIKENILADYFEKLKREDRGMIFGEYSYKDHMDVVREEGFEDACIENAKNLLRMNILTTEQISQAVSLPIEQVLALADELKVEN